MTDPSSARADASATRGLASLCGASIASSYYVQPLLVAISASFGLGGAQVGLIPMIGQIAIGLGVLLLVPLGDVVDNRRMVAACIAGQIASMLLVAWSSSFTGFLLASSALGLLTIAPYLIPAYASRFTAPSERGRVTGSIVQGFILGILFARTFGGIVGAYAGWRVVYFVAAIATLLLLLKQARSMPHAAPPPAVAYRELLASLPVLLCKEPVLRRAALTQALMFGTFGSLWIALSLHIQSDAFGLSSATVGLFGLLGLVSATVAPRVGKLIDRFGQDIVTRFGIALTIAAWAVMRVFGHSLPALALGVVLLDIGASSVHIAKQSALLTIGGVQRSRMLTVYIVGQYIGGGLLAALTGLAWSQGGWRAVCFIGIATVSVALIVNSLPGRGNERRSAPH